jgi:hypothetical protein
MLLPLTGCDLQLSVGQAAGLSGPASTAADRPAACPTDIQRSHPAVTAKLDALAALAVQSANNGPLRPLSHLHDKHAAFPVCVIGLINVGAQARVPVEPLGLR